MTQEQIENNRNRFLELLYGTERSETGRLADWLDNIGFFKAPASAGHHLAEPGGLCQHSLNVYEQAHAIAHLQRELNPGLVIDERSLTLVALLHDVCKADVYQIVEKFRKDKDGKWEKYKAYVYDANVVHPVGHGEKSVIDLLTFGFNLYPQEIAAIRWHMAGWDLSNYREARECFNKACDKYPLLPILIAADELATRITENQTEKT